MIIKVSEIPDEGLDVDTEEDVEIDGSVSKARLALRLLKSGESVLIDGTIDTTVHLSCGRCLKEFDEDLSIPVNLVYTPAERFGEEEAHELSTEDMNTGFYREDEIDLGDISREQVLLSMPMRPLCSDTCKGICPVCGTNLNEQTCSCDRRKVDERFKVLENYFKKGKE